MTPAEVWLRRWRLAMLVGLVLIGVGGLYADAALWGTGILVMLISAAGMTLEREALAAEEDGDDER